MEFLITESQLRTILEQQGNEKFTRDLKIMKSFTTNLLQRVLKVYSLNLKMLTTFGTSVGGFMMPLDNYIRTGNFNLTDDQRMLVLAGVVFITFFENRRGLNKILELIKKEKIEGEFETVLNKGLELKNAFEGFLNLVKSTSSVFLEVVAYSFLIPITTDIIQVANQSKSVNEAAILIAERLIAAGIVFTGRDVLITILKKIIKKLKN
jgi:hypothetical protein